MKVLWLLLSFLLSRSPYAQTAEHINFQSGLSWQQVLAKAKAENKMVFVDLYTDWCVPCKRMESEIFTLKRVADTFNTKFINYRINAEKGEGIDVAKRYGVGGYPYFIFVDGEGSLYYSMLGYREERQLLQDADIAFRERNDPKPYGKWQEEYDANRYDTAWMRGYIGKRNKLRMDNARLIEDFYDLLQLTDYMKTPNLQLVIGSSGIDLNGKVFRILTKNFNAIPPKEDSLYRLQQSLLNVFEGAFNKVWVKAFHDKDEETLQKKVLTAYTFFPTKVRYVPWYDKQDANRWKFIFYRQTNNAATLKKFIPVATAYLSKYYMSKPVANIKSMDSMLYSAAVADYQSRGMDAQQLANIMPMLEQYFKTYATNDHLEKLSGAVAFVLSCPATPAQLSAALAWSKRALAIKSSSETLELHAKLLYRLDKKEEAIDTMQAAVDAADNESDKTRLGLLVESMKEGERI